MNQRVSTLDGVFETGLWQQAFDDLASVLDRLAQGHLKNRIEELLPWNFMSSLAAAA